MRDKFNTSNARKNEFIPQREVKNKFIRQYLENGYGRTEGWPNFPMPQVIDWLTTPPINRDGGVMEIGVHGGTSFILLNQTVSSGDSVAIDLFNEYQYNVSCSGGFGDKVDHLKYFRDNLKRFDYRHGGSNVRTISGDSLILEPEEIHQGNRFKFISIDGGHDAIHVINDLRLSERCLATDGVVILDDWLSPHWLGVTEGVIRYMMNQGTLVPFAASERKLYLSNYSIAEKYRDFARQSSYRIIEDSVCGHTVCHFIVKEYRN